MGTSEWKLVREVQEETATCPSCSKEARVLYVIVTGYDKYPDLPGGRLEMCWHCWRRFPAFVKDARPQV
jgi:hypothetical protein